LISLVLWVSSPDSTVLRPAAGGERTAPALRTNDNNNNNNNNNKPNQAGRKKGEKAGSLPCSNQ
jgi:hypothetical protein